MSENLRKPTVRSSVLLVVALVHGVAACGPSSSAKSGLDLKPKAIVVPPGLSLVSACTPTGPEICFNGVDDNCNGVLEEGCGLGTGPLQFVVAWGGPADIDLIVTDPSGFELGASTPSRQSPSGLHLDRDCPKECNEQNAENVFFEGPEPPHGSYIVRIKLDSLHDAPSPVKARLGARVGTRTYGVDFELLQSDEQKSFTFRL